MGSPALFVNCWASQAQRQSTKIRQLAEKCLKVGLGWADARSPTKD